MVYKVDIEKQRANYARVKEEAEASFDLPLFLPKPGRNEIRILPPWSTELEFARRCGIHFVNIGSSVKMVPCFRETWSEPCYLCQQVQPLRDVNKELFTQLRVKKRYAANVLDINKVEDGPKVYMMPVSVYTDIVAHFAEGIDLSDPVEGRNVIIDKQGTGINTEYHTIVSTQPTPIPEEICEMLHNLDEFLSKPKLEELESIWSKTGNPIAPLSVPETPVKPALVAPTEKEPVTERKEVNKDELLARLKKQIQSSKK